MLNRAFNICPIKVFLLGWLVFESPILFHAIDPVVNAGHYQFERLVEVDGSV